MDMVCCPADDPGVSTSDGEAERLRAQLRTLQGEFEEYRRRMERELERREEDTLLRLIPQLTPVYDALEQAASASVSPSSPGRWRHYVEGIQAIGRQFGDTLAGMGVERMRSLGQPFDPHQHEAVAIEKPGPYHPEGTISKVLQEGYTFRGRVVKHAQVVVVGASGSPRVEIEV